MSSWFIQIASIQTVRGSASYRKAFKAPNKLLVTGKGVPLQVMIGLSVGSPQQYDSASKRQYSERR